jgi:iron complex outermembrane receptor protein
MKRLRYVVGALLTVLWWAPLRAQQPTGTIRGHIVDDATQEPLAGVTVAVGSRGTQSQADGGYIITRVPAGTDSLRARMLGYAPAARRVTVVGADTVVTDLALSPQAAGLSEMVMVGYGQQRAGDVTGAVTQLTPAEFNLGRIISPEQFIAAKVAGVQVVDNNEPGGSLSIRIRGATATIAGSDPLYVIDGMPVGTGTGGGLSVGRDPLNVVNPDDIASITVLKGAEAASIYGVNAANGVVIITTKSGRGGPRIEYGGSMSSSSVTRLPDLLNAAEFRGAVQQYAPQNVSQLGSANTAWFDQVDRSAFGQAHNLAVSGAGLSNSYRLSLGYLNQDGVIQGTTTERLSLVVNLDQRLFNDHLDVRINLKGSRLTDRFTPGGVLSNAAQMGPTQPVRDSTSVTGYYNWPGNSLQSADNPVQILALASDHGTTSRSLGNLRADYRLPFFEALKASLNLGYDVAEADRETSNSSLLHSQVRTGTGGTDYSTKPRQGNTLLEAYLNYAAPLDVVPGNIDVTAGYSHAQSHAEYPWVQLTGLGTNPVTASGSVIDDSKLKSFFGRLNYNFADRYLATMSLRRDLSSRRNAWGTFPSVALAWRMSQEPFMRHFTGLSDLKLRASWARTGNQFVNPTALVAVDPNIKWEATNSHTVGLDFGFLGQRFSGSIDWYTKKTTDLIFTVPVAAGTNFSNYLTTNIGSMRHHGVEFSLSSRVMRGRGGHLSWTATFTASHNTNELLSINPSRSVSRILTGGISGGVGNNIEVLQPGQPINSFFVYQQKYGANERPIYSDTLIDMYVDQNSDGIINSSDRRPFHDPAPKWQLGHTSYLTYHSFDLSFTLRAYLGNYVYNNVASANGAYQNLTGSGIPSNLHASVLETGFVVPQYYSDYFVEDASFLRLDNITLGCTFQYRGQPLRVYAAVQNVFTMTGYSGVDPTAGLNGIDNNVYPRSRTVTGGLSVRL